MTIKPPTRRQRFAAIDRLEGTDYERALAGMDIDDRRAYMRGAVSDVARHQVEQMKSDTARLDQIEQLGKHFGSIDLLTPTARDPQWTAVLNADPDINDWAHAVEHKAPTLRGALDALFHAVATLPYTTWDADGTEHKHNAPGG